MRFRDLNINDTFDFIGPDRMLNSFYLRCVKVGSRKYNDENNGSHRVGSIDCEVFHVVRTGIAPAA